MLPNHGRFNSREGGKRNMPSNHGLFHFKEGKKYIYTHGHFHSKGLKKEGK